MTDLAALGEEIKTALGGAVTGMAMARGELTIEVSGEPSFDAGEAALRGQPGTADPVVADHHGERAAVVPHPHPGVLGRGVLGGIGQRLGDREVDGRFDRGGRAPVDVDVHLDGPRVGNRE